MRQKERDKTKVNKTDKIDMMLRQTYTLWPTMNDIRTL